MLYLLGGASRSGKSSLARRLLEDHGIAYFSLDVLMMGLANGCPSFALDPDDTAEVRAGRLWPLVRAMAANLLEEEATHPTYLLEGDSLLPRQAAGLMDAYPGRVRACFIGYARVDPAAKLREVRAAEADWLSGYGDDQVRAFLADAVRFSRYLEAECSRCRLPYFDGSTDHAAALAKAYRFLTGLSANLAPDMLTDIP